ncbi:PREDICTED: mast cell protease 1A-like [Charadrius vociferus]|uniref:mast cell protease 1A-like n=1 Tax=Charadrius vociferus TaxID=50402 RepID=UPI000521C446|nr:PREDICTED: mast cell protease 1A-like [Charadrius vociferus]
MSGRIIGGSEAKPHSRPYMAYLSIRNVSHEGTCGGFLIRPDAVLSAAHCVNGTHQSYVSEGKVAIIVILGAHNVYKELSWQVFHIKHWVIHPNYSRDIDENYIMLLKLNLKAKKTKEVSPIDLPSHNEQVKPETTCEVAGWGDTSIPSKMPSVLMKADLKVQRGEVCKASFNNDYLEQSMICVGDEDGNKASFKGDSGGPLVCNGKAHGIVSYGPKYCIFPEVFTRVSYFEPWIRQELRKFALQVLPDSPSSD